MEERIRLLNLRVGGPQLTALVENVTKVWCNFVLLNISLEVTVWYVRWNHVNSLVLINLDYRSLLLGYSI